MTDVVLIRVPHGFIPHPESAEAVRKIKVGTECQADVRQPRNYKFHKKWFALARILFDIWCEIDRTLEYKGEKVLANFERFRRDLTVLCGHYEPVYNIRGEVRLEPKSISFASMSEDEFEQLYQQTINVGLQKIIPANRYTEEELRSVVDTVAGFA